MTTLIIMSLVCGGLGYAIAGDESKPLGIVLGLLLGPLGLVVAALAARK